MTMNAALTTLTIAAALGCAVMAGVFFAFSALVMKALARVPVAQGIAVMQAINAAAISVVFLAVLLGTAAACVALTVISFVRWGEDFAVFLLAGGGVYLVGTMLLTMAYHVPRNEALAPLDPGGADAARLWATFLPGWTAWNHARGLAALGASTLFVVAVSVG